MTFVDCLSLASSSLLSSFPIEQSAGAGKEGAAVSAGAIAGIVIGVVAVVIGAILLFLFLKRKEEPGGHPTADLSCEPEGELQKEFNIDFFADDLFDNGNGNLNQDPFGRFDPQLFTGDVEEGAGISIGFDND
jgi:hypothetical protein